MAQILENVEMIVGLISFVLVAIGIFKIHKATKTKNTFMMFFAGIATIVFTIIYLAMWISYTFYYSPDDSPVALSLFMGSIDYIYTVLFLIGAVGFWGFSNSFKKNVVK